MLTDRPQWPSPFPPAAKFWAQHQPWAISPPSFSWWRWPEDLEMGSHILQICTASGQHLGWLITRCCNICILYICMYTQGCTYIIMYKQSKPFTQIGPNQTIDPFQGIFDQSISPPAIYHGIGNRLISSKFATNSCVSCAPYVKVPRYNDEDPANFQPNPSTKISGIAKKNWVLFGYRVPENCRSQLPTLMTLRWYSESSYCWASSFHHLMDEFGFSF